MKHQIAMLKFNKFSQKYRVYYEDTDAGGVMYYANYLKFFERGRTDFLRESKMNQSELMAQKGLVFVVRRCEIDYLAPAKLDDLVEISVEVIAMKGASLEIAQEMSANGKFLSRAIVKIVCVDVDGFKPRRVEEAF